jgi:hypothetical protein
MNINGQICDFVFLFYKALFSFLIDDYYNFINILRDIYEIQINLHEATYMSLSLNKMYLFMYT